MASDRYLTAVGLTDEAMAHLRLLLRRPRPSVRQRWQWGNENNADLLIVDGASYAGRMARDRAASGGRRCAVFNDDQELRSNELPIQMPLTAEGLFDLLNQAAKRTENAGMLVVDRRDEFDEIAAEFARFNEAPFDAAEAQPSADVAPSLEDVLLRNEASSRAQTSSLQLRAGATTEAADRVSPRSLARSPFSNVSSEAMPDNPTLPRSTPGTAQWLTAYLDGDVLRSPSVISHSGIAPLVIDPKNRVFLSPAPYMQDLVEYCTRTLQPSEWRILTTAELQQARNDCRARPFAHLQWLYAWLHSEGRLAAHLPPSANFRLLVWPDIDDAAESHRRIADALMRPGRLHEIAARSGTEQSDVIDLVNAYDKIGLIDIGRPGVRTAVASAKPGLLTRLKHTLSRPR